MKTLINSSNKRANLLTIWWFLVIVIITLGIVAGTYMFYSYKIDTRMFEANLLADKIFGCIVQNGYIDTSVLSKDSDIFSKCNLNEKIINESGDYYIFLNISDSSNILKNLELGNMAFRDDCKVLGAVQEAENFPRCYTKTIPVLNSTGDKLELTITAGSNYGYRVGE